MTCSAQMKLCSLLAVAVLALASSAFAQLAPLSPDGFVRLETIVNEFATNPDAATAKYNGKRIIVYGPVALRWINREACVAVRSPRFAPLPPGASWPWPRSWTLRHERDFSAA